MTSHSPPGGIGDNRKLAIRYVELSTLKILPDSPRTYSNTERKRAKRILKRFDLQLPLVIDADNHVVVGELLRIVAEELGYREVATVLATGFSRVELEAMSVAYARLGETGGWDSGKLGSLLLKLEIELPEFDLPDLGFEVGEIDLAIAAAEGNEEEEETVEIGPQVARAGDLFRLDRHRLLAGNALAEADVARLMYGKLAAAMFADPPYNVPIDGFVSGKGRTKHREFAIGVGELSVGEFTDFLANMAELAAKFSVGGAVHFICMDWRHMRELLEAGARHYAVLLNLCVWVKDRPGMGSHWRSQHELVFVYRVGPERQRNNVQLGRFGRSRSNIWTYPSAATFMKQSEDRDLLKQHPTPKPVKLVADALLDCTARGDVVLDPFLGSGTTLVAAERIGRICHGMDLDPLYVDLSIRRWQSWTGQAAVHDESGLTFDELALRRQEEGANG